MAPFRSIAIVVPVLDEAESLTVLLEEIRSVMTDLPYRWEVVVVDDGSIDDSAALALQLGARVLRSARNHGKAAALQAGFDSTDSDVVVTLDGDLQDDPTEIPNLLRALEEADLVSGWKEHRKDPRNKRVQSRIFGWAVRVLSGVRLHDFNCGIKAYRREVLETIRLYGGLHRLTPVLAHNAGFEVTEIPVHHRPRMHGRSHYGLARAIRGPLDLATVLFLGRFRYRPLHFFGLVGLAMGLAGIGIAAYLSWLRLALGETIGDRPLLLLSVLMILGGLQLFSIGLLGEMVLASSRPRGSLFRELSRDTPQTVNEDPISSNAHEVSSLPPWGSVCVGRCATADRQERLESVREACSWRR